MKLDQEFIPFRRVGIAAALLAMFAFTPVSRAAIIVNNNGNNNAGATSTSDTYAAQVFTMTGNTANLGSLQLVLDTTHVQTVDVYIYAASGGAATGSGTMIGTVTTTTAGNVQVDTVTLNTAGLAESLVNGSQYAIALQLSSTLSWDWTATPNQVGSSGTSFPSLHEYTTGGLPGTWTTGGTDYLMFELQTVPEPITSSMAVFGLIFVSIGAGRFYLARRRSSKAS